MPSAGVVILTASTHSVDGLERIVLDEAYVTAIESAGLSPLILPPVDALRALRALDAVSGLLLTGGEDIDPACYGAQPHPACGASHSTRDACEIALAKHAQTLRIPTLAICRGAQILNVALGGTLIQDINASHPRNVARIHEVALDPQSRLAAIIECAEPHVNSTHHQAIDCAGNGIHITGRANDGTVEAIESIDREWWMLGVQWHPQLLVQTAEDWDRRLFAAFAHEVLLHLS